jgi:hypothetical protein
VRINQVLANKLLGQTTLIHQTAVIDGFKENPVITANIVGRKLPNQR